MGNLNQALTMAFNRSSPQTHTPIASADLCVRSSGLNELNESQRYRMRTRGLRGWAGLLGLGLALGGVLWPRAAAAASWQTTFDNAGSVAWWWVPPYGSPTPTAGWDGTQNAGSNPASGSFAWAEVFTSTGFEWCNVPILLLDASNNPMVLDGTVYTALTFDLKVAPGTAPSTSGDYGQLEVGFISTNLAYGYIGGLAGPIQIPLSATNWTRFTLLVNPATPHLERVGAVRFSMYSNTNSWTRSPNTVTFNLDNLALYGTCCPPWGQLQIIGGQQPGEVFRLRWPLAWTGVALQASTDLKTWHDTGLETNAVATSDSWEVPIPAGALPSSSNGFWRLRAPTF
jgi:hypothetical protein